VTGDYRSIEQGLDPGDPIPLNMYEQTDDQLRELGISTLPRTLLWERSSVDAWGRFSSPILGCQVNGVFDLVAPCRRSHR